MKLEVAVTGTVLLALAGCRAYEAAPIDWAREGRAWMERGELAFSSLDDAARVALVGNAELNLLRLKRASSEGIAKATGWWEDPEFDVDLMRIVNPSEHPMLGGASLAMTIPLSGVKGLERKAAEAYTAADAADIAVSELETWAVAREAAVRYLSACETAQALRSFESDERVVAAVKAAERLSESGELSKTETASARLRRHQRLHRLREAEAAAAEAELSLRRLLGVAPPVRLRFDGFDGSGSLEGPAAVDPLDLVRHPKVRAALCRMDGDEAALEAEIRRQYPDLKLGPAYSREEGLDRFGIVAGFSLPLWNRNRKGIAEAEGARDVARANAVAAWREVVLGADAAQKALARLKDHSPEVPPSREAADRLSDAGEMNALEYLAVREETLDAELAEREWRRDVKLAEEGVRKWLATVD